MGDAAGLLYSLTEKTDTTKWQTLPHTIYFTILSLPTANNDLKLRINPRVWDQYNQTNEINFEISTGETRFHTFYSLE